MRVSRPDANQPEIVAYLRGHGVEVIDMSSVGKIPDLLCYHRGFVGFIEIKVPGSRAQYKRMQLEFIAHTKIPVAICKDKYEAMRYMEQGLGLSQAEKNAIAFLLTRSQLKNFSRKPVEAAIANASKIRELYT